MLGATLSLPKGRGRRCAALASDRSGWPRAPSSPCDQAGGQATAAAQPRLRPGHTAVVVRVVVVVAQKVKETMKGENAQLGLVGVASLTGLALRHASGDDDIADEPGSGIRGSGSAIRRKRQHVGRVVLSPVLPIQLADVGIGDERDGDLALEARGDDRGEPAGQATSGDPAAPAVGHRHADASTVGIHRTIRTP
jgi:hypothetical protein